MEFDGTKVKCSFDSNESTFLISGGESFEDEIQFHLFGKKCAAERNPHSFGPRWVPSVLTLHHHQFWVR